MWQSIRALIFDPRTLFVVYVCSAVFISVQLVMLGTHLFVTPPLSHNGDIMNDPAILSRFIGTRFTEYNNYVVYKQSFFHLLRGNNLYTIYPTQQWDLYKYSPTFALFMGLLAYLPDVIGVSVWNILNVVTLFIAVRMLPFTVRVQCIILWFIANDLLTCLSNVQSNGLLCALIIAVYCCLQNGKLVWATLWLVVATYIKVYGAIGFCLFLFYPGKLKFILYALLWTVILAALPLLVTPFQTLVWQYHNWAAMMVADAAAATGLSVSGWLNSWFGVINGKAYITLAGLVLFLLPFLRFRMYADELFKLLTLASMLVWVIIFNHKAESPTYIIAVTGVAIWYFAMPRATWRTVLILFVFVFTGLSGTDFFPQFIRLGYILPYKIKALPCIITWCVIFTDMMLLKRGEWGTTASIAINNINSK